MMITKPMRRILPLCVIIVTACYGRPCFAQLQPVKIQGVIAGISPQGVAIRTDKNQLMLALIHPVRLEDGVRYQGIPPITLEVLAEQKPDHLQLGMYVRFPAKVQAKRRVVEPITEVTVIDGAKITDFGVFPDELPDLPEEGAEEPAAKTTEVADSLVVGRIATARRNEIMVVFPDGKSLKARLAKDAVVHVKASDIRFAKPGYLVEAEGMLVKPNKFFATSMKITEPVVKPKGTKPAPDKLADKGKKVVPKPGAAKPAGPEISDPFKIGNPNSPAKTADKPAKLRGRILDVN